MATFNVHEAKTQFSRLLDEVLEGEEVVITRNGAGRRTRACASTRSRFWNGTPRFNINSAAGEGWWQAMTDAEATLLYRRKVPARYTLLSGQQPSGT